MKNERRVACQEGYKITTHIKAREETAWLSL